ncbi:SDR family NAD(P)-dependent oxidoreductase [Spirillospora sp. CA-255316]
MGEGPDGFGGGNGFGGGAVAIVGAGCRLPGGITDLDGLWAALERGDDLVGQVPPDRFDADLFVDERMPRASRSYTRAGGFLDLDLGGFDAAYFGISPKEAAAMDPQQRLLLEMAVEALDDAGIDPASLAGSDTGVFVGISDPAYGALQTLEPGGANPYTMSGAALSIASNRLSHVFDLRGPSMSIDTACSSSLLAVERGWRTLVEGRGRVVLAGGVNVLLGPGPYIGFSQASMLSPTGRCRAFSAEADGFVRAEGGGVVVLKRLADAVADGDRIHAVIVGAGTNNDGRTVGLSLPNPDAQEDLLRRVYTEAGVDADDVVYVEAHGTGTLAGDPAECRSLGRALGRARTRGPLPIGSVKTNLGHLEPASGMPGLFKALLVLRHRTVPASLHADTLNPDIDFEGLGLRVATRPLPLQDVGERSVVGVNSFGFGGANVHVALASPPPASGGEAGGTAAGLPVVVSARTLPALRQAVVRAAEALASTGERDFYDVAYTASRRRGKHPHRAVVVADSPEAAARALTRLTDDQPAEASSGDTGSGDAGSGAASSGERARRAGAGAALGEAVEHGRVALVFSGNGSQWAGMGADLLEDATFRAAVTAVDAELAPLLGWSVLEELASPPERWRLAATEVAQPLLFAVQVGVVEMLRASGVRPAAVLGHSVGEVAAAYTAGALAPPQAARVIAERGKAQALTRGLGRMAAVRLPEAQARQLLHAYPGLEVSAVNTDRDITVAGPAESLKRLGEDMAARGIFFRELDLDYPFHSAAMDPIREGLEEGLAGLRPGPTRIPLVSTVTGAVVQGTELDASYWWQNVRRPVRFEAAAQHAIEEGCDVLLEVGPHPVLRSYLRRVNGNARARGAVAATLRRGEPGPACMRDAVAHLIAVGACVDWDDHFPRPGAVRPLPAYPWQRERHWIGRPNTWVPRIGDATQEHPMLGERTPSLQPAWTGELDPGRLPWLEDHRAGGVPVLPATGYLEMMIAAGRLALPDAAGAVEVDQVEISRALVLSPATDTEPVCVGTSLAVDTGVVTVAGAENRSKRLRENCRGRVRALLRPAPPPLDADELRARISTPVDVAGYYARAAEGNMAWGPHFQVLTGLWRGDGEVLGSYACPAQEDERYQAHPVVLDSALQAGVLWLVDELRSGTGYMPAAIGSVRLWGRPAAEGLLHVRERSRTGDEVCWDITVADLQGRVSVEMRGCRLRRVRGSLAAPLARYELVLRAAPRETASRAEPQGGVPADGRGAAGSAGILARAAEPIDRVRSGWHELEYEAFAAQVEKAFAHALAHALAPALDAAATFTPEQLAQVCHAPHHRRMLHLALPMLERHGLMERVDDTVRGAPHLRWAAPPEDLDVLHRTLIWRGTGFAAHGALAVRVGRRLPELLDGRRTAADLLAGGGADLLEQFHEIGPVSLFVNRIVRALLEEIVREWPADRPLRVLEVGAGTGGTTAAVLPVLPADRTRYTVTDIGETALTRLRQRFAGRDFVDHAPLDLDRDPGEQGLPAGGFDVVIAVDTLHLAEDLTASLRRLSALLAPGGRLLAAEPHRAGPLLPIRGMLEEFWRFRDHDLRPHSPLLPRDQWPAVLAEAGFTGVVQAGDDREPGRGDFSVMLATAACGPAAAVPPPRPAEARPDEARPDEALDEVRPDQALDEARPDEARPDEALDEVRPDQALDEARPDEARPDEARLEASDVWIIAAEDGACPAPALEAALRERGGRPDRSPLSTDPDHWVSRVPPHARTVTFAVVLGDADAAGPGPEAVVEQITRRAAALRAIALAGDHLPQELPVSLWLVARPCGALPEPDLPDVETYPQDAATWGTARSLGNEHPRLAVRRVCLHPTGDAALDADRLAAELLAPSEEDEILLTRRGRFVPRLREAPPATIPSTDIGGAYRLAVHDPGLSYTLAWHQTRRPAPGPGQVAIEVRAAGVNYRDVMRSVDLLPTEAIEAVFGWHELGLECAGIVTAAGPGVTGLKPGDRVVTAGPVGFGDHTVAEAWATVLLPGHMTFPQAACLPMARMTAAHSLVHLARVRAGETVLVHGGAGGVGLAALQIAQALGVRVIATAGTPAKRELLRALGADHVLDSRSLHFAERVRDLTGGLGVDVVVNSLAGEAITRGLEVLRHGGRFIELGKRDIYENRPVPLRPFGDNIALFGVDVGTLMWKDPERMAEEVAEGIALCRSGGMRPLPHTVYPAARVDEAFALMRHSRHIGKVVISFDPRDEPVAVRPERMTSKLDPGGTYLVTGGLSGFGAATARRLAGLGARHLALVGRRGADTPEASALLADLRGMGVGVGVHAADAADRAAMRRILDDLDAEGRPVRGVVHAAMHLDDAPLTELSDERIRAVLHPKVAGAAVLDELTRDRPLDLFVMYSSVAALGNIGQSAYAAANLYLEALARRRRRDGRPALTVALGPLAETGVVARGGRAQAQALAVFGGEPMRPAQALAAIEDLLAERAGVALVGRVDWGRLSRALPTLRRPMTAALLPPGLEEQEAGQEQLLEMLARMDAEEAHAFLVGQITRALSEVLLVPADQIAPDRRLDEYGMDSLMGAELLASVRARYGVDIPPMEMLRSGGTVTDIAQVVLLRLGLSTAGTRVQAPASRASASGESASRESAASPPAAGAEEPAAGNGAVPPPRSADDGQGDHPSATAAAGQAG